MNGNIFKSAGLAVGIMIGLIIAVALILIANNNRKVRTEYDERQIRVRGDAYRYAFYTLMVWEIIMFILAYGGYTFSGAGAALHFAGVILGCLVLSAVCIWKDAYWGLNNNRRRYGIILIVAGLLNVIPIVGALKGADMGDFPWVNALVCVMLVIVGAELLIKHFLDRRAEGAGE